MSKKLTRENKKNNNKEKEQSKVVSIRLPEWVYTHFMNVDEQLGTSRIKTLLVDIANRSENGLNFQDICNNIAKLILGTPKSDSAPYFTMHAIFSSFLNSIVGDADERNYLKCDSELNKLLRENYVGGNSHKLFSYFHYVMAVFSHRFKEYNFSIFNLNVMILISLRCYILINTYARIYYLKNEEQLQSRFEELDEKLENIAESQGIVDEDGSYSISISELGDEAVEMNFLYALIENSDIWEFEAIDMKKVADTFGVNYIALEDFIFFDVDIQWYHQAQYHFRKEDKTFAEVKDLMSYDGNNNCTRTLTDEALAFALEIDIKKYHINLSEVTYSMLEQEVNNTKH